MRAVVYFASDWTINSFFSSFNQSNLRIASLECIFLRRRRDAPEKGKRKRSPNDVAPYGYGKVTIAERKIAVRDMRKGVDISVILARFPNIRRPTIEGWKKEFANDDALEIQAGDELLCRRKPVKFSAINKRVLEYVHGRVADVGRASFGTNHLGLQVAAARIRDELLNENAAKVRTAFCACRQRSAVFQVLPWMDPILSSR